MRMNGFEAQTAKTNWPLPDSSNRQPQLPTTTILGTQSTAPMGPGAHITPAPTQLTPTVAPRPTTNGKNPGPTTPAQPVVLPVPISLTGGHGTSRPNPQTHAPYIPQYLPQYATPYWYTPLPYAGYQYPHSSPYYHQSQPYATLGYFPPNPGKHVPQPEVIPSGVHVPAQP